MAIKGYWRRLLRIDLTHETADSENIPGDVICRYVGAKGLGAYYLIKDLLRGAAPLSPENRIVLATGPFQGTDIISSGRFAAITKSPLTGIFLDSYCGGTFGPGLKKCGFDLVIIEGKAERPVYILIENSRAEIKDAGHLWGKDTSEVESLIKASEGKDTGVVSIGIAGEHRVLFSCLISDKRRAAGRGGVGAVFGAKNLKAVAVRGTLHVPVHDPEAIKKLNRGAVRAVKAGRERGERFFIQGTSSVLEYAHQADRLPTLNSSQGEWKFYKGLDGETIHAENRVIPHPCCTCPTACGGSIVSRDLERPEYETLAMLGANCGIKRYETVAEANRLCNLFGLDTISTGNVIGFAMECSEKGIIGEEIRFGDSEKLLTLIEQIAHREGIGGKLALGTKHLAELWGHTSQSFAMNVKGLELPAWNCRGKLGQGLAYMTADIGGSHLRDNLPDFGPPTRPAAEVVEELVKGQNQSIAKDNYILCAFALFSLRQETCFDYFKAVTGMESTESKIQATGEMIFTLIRAFNCREGIGRKDDDLPARALNEALPSGIARGCRAFASKEDKEESLNRYYELRGWDQNGVSRKETLERLGIDVLD